MKKKFAAIAALLASLTACICVLTACFSIDTEKTFEKSGMRITLTTAFQEKDVLSQTVCYESRSEIVTALKESFSLMPGFGRYTIEDYTNLILKNNKLFSTTYTRDGKDYMFFTYEKTVDDKQIYYVATTHKSSDAFWLIQFACNASEKTERVTKFLAYADTITFFG